MDEHLITLFAAQGGVATSAQILRHLTRKLTGYALGRPLNRFDNCVINDAMAALAAHEYRPSALIETIALSKPFRYRYYAESDIAQGGTP